MSSNILKWLRAVVICPCPSLTVNMSPQLNRNSRCSCSNVSPYPSLFVGCQNILFLHKTTRPLSLFANTQVGYINRDTRYSLRMFWMWVSVYEWAFFLTTSWPSLCAWIRKTFFFFLCSWIWVRFIVCFFLERSRQRLSVCAEDFRNKRGSRRATDCSNCACNSLHFSSELFFLSASLFYSTLN